MNKTKIRFWGCRGSFPTPDKDKMIYGGDTSCVEIKTSDNQSIILDMGSGLKNLGEKIVNDTTYPNQINIFLSHYHLDHIMGFLMFAPLFDEKYKINIYSRSSKNKGLKDILETFLQPEIWPMNLEMLNADVVFKELDDNDIIINSDTKVTNSLHPHPNSAFSISIHTNDKKITYVTDCEHPKDRLNMNVVEFAKNSDILIHDAQYTPEDLIIHTGWGHSSWKSAIDVAIQSNSKKLVLFHYSPDYSDDDIKDIEKKAGLDFSDVIAAKQDLEIEI